MGVADASGIIVIDKPAGISSARVVAMVKKQTGAARAGHAGTLDPFATGVLVCGLNGGTRLMRFFLHEEKTYEAVLHLGIETDTQDATGAVIAEQAPPASLDSAAFRAILDRFTGKIRQLPPVFSALKHQGVPLYKLARRGTPVQKPSREVTVHAIEMVAEELPRINLTVRCSGGTYIRTLCSDIGRELGVGGHLAALRRTESSGFSIKEAMALETLETAPPEQVEAKRISMTDALRGMSAWIADDRLAARIGNGIPLSGDDLDRVAGTGIAGPSPLVKVVDRDHRLLAVIEWDNLKSRYNYCCVFPK